MERGSRMSNVGYKEPASKRSILRKDIGSCVEKENYLLSLRKSRIAKLSSNFCGENRDCDENLPKRRVSLSQGESNREDSRSALADVNARKTPFHVHLDEQNEETKETCSEAKRIRAPKPMGSQKTNGEHESKIPVRKPPNLVRSHSVNPPRGAVPLKEVRSSSLDLPNSKSRVSKTTQVQVALPVFSRKEHQASSNSTQVPNTKSRVSKTSQSQVALPAKTTSNVTTTRKIGKVPSEALPKDAQVSTTSSKLSNGSTRSLSSLRLRIGREGAFKGRVSVIRDILKNEATTNSKAATAGKKIPEGRAEKIFPKKELENLEMKSERRGSLHQERIPCTSGSIVTPIDGPPPAPLMPIKALIKRTKETAANSMKKRVERQGTVVGFACPVELVYHMEYQNDLLNIEKERDERAPQLSEHFLRRHINAHQRKEIVSYLIHLGVHCRYPSFVIYQTVKLFDATMDRLPVATERMQLTALAALWICLKRLEVYRKIPSAATIIALAKEMYVGQEELLMVYERKVLQAVDFNISFADAFSLLSHYIIQCKRQVDISEETTALIYSYGAYMIDLTMLDERFCRPPASLVSFVVAELALVLVQDSIESVQALKTRWRYCSIATDSYMLDSFESSYKTEVKEVNGLRAAIVRSIRDSGNKRLGYEVVYKKYNRSRYGGISDSLVERAKRLPSLDTSEY